MKRPLRDYAEREAGDTCQRKSNQLSLLKYSRAGTATPQHRSLEAVLVAREVTLAEWLT
jgi:hypothetical protein